MRGQIDRRRGRHGPAHLGDQPHRARRHPPRPPREHRRSLPRQPAAGRELPTAPDTAVQRRAEHGKRSGAQRRTLEHGQCTPCPTWKKKLTMAGAAPMRSAPTPRRAPSASRERLVVVLRMGAEGPRRGADHETYQGQDQCPPAESVGQLLQHRLAGEVPGIGVSVTVETASCTAQQLHVDPSPLSSRRVGAAAVPESLRVGRGKSDSSYFMSFYIFPYDHVRTPVRARR